MAKKHHKLFKFSEIRKKLQDNGINIAESGMIKDSQGREISNTFLLNTAEYIDYSELNTERILEFIPIMNGEILKTNIKCPINSLEKELIPRARAAIGQKFIFSYDKRAKTEYLNMINTVRDACIDGIMINQIGWHYISENYYYYCGNRFIAADTSELPREYIVSDEISKYNFGISENGISEKKSFDAFKALLNVGSIAVILPLFSFSIMNFARTLLRTISLEPMFFMSLIGKSGTFKTTLSVLLFNGSRNSDRNPLSSFKDTVSMIQYKMFLTRDSTLIVDDLYPAKSKRERERLEHTLESISRSTSDGTFKGRMDSSMNPQKELPCNCGVVITSESIPEGESQLSRNYIIEIGENSIESENLLNFQKYSSELAALYKYYIEWLSDNMDSVLVEYKNIFYTNQSNLQIIKVHGRVKDQINHLWIAFTLFLKYAVERRLLKEKESNNLQKLFKRVLFEHILRMQSLIDGGDVIVMFSQALEDLIATNSIRVHQFKGKKPNGIAIAWEDDKFYYLNAHKIYEGVCNYWVEQRLVFPKNMKSLHRELSDAGIISTQKDGNTIDYTVKVAVTNDSKFRPRVLKINKERLHEYVTRNLSEKLNITNLSQIKLKGFKLNNNLDNNLDEIDDLEIISFLDAYMKLKGIQMNHDEEDKNTYQNQTDDSDNILHNPNKKFTYKLKPEFVTKNVEFKLRDEFVCNRSDDSVHTVENISNLESTQKTIKTGFLINSTLSPRREL